MATPLPGANLPLEYLHEYDDAALDLARRGLTGAISDPLPPSMGSPGALDYIQADPEAFQKRIREMAYWLAFETPYPAIQRKG